MDILELVHEDRSSAERPFGCDTCGKAFARRSDLVRHQRIHSNERPWSCDWPGCTRDFIQHSALKVHRRVHTGERPHRCEYEGCDKAFSDSSSLARHRRIHTGKRPYKCPDKECGRTFCRKTTLTKHVTKHHPTSPDYAEGRFEFQTEGFDAGPELPMIDYEEGYSPLSTPPPPDEYYSDGHQASPPKLQRPPSFRSVSYGGYATRQSTRVPARERLRVTVGGADWGVEEQERLREHIEAHKDKDKPPHLPLLPPPSRLSASQHEVEEEHSQSTPQRFASPPPQHPRHMMQSYYSSAAQAPADTHEYYQPTPQHQQYHHPSDSQYSSHHYHQQQYLPTPVTPLYSPHGQSQPMQHSWSVPSSYQHHQYQMHQPAHHQPQMYHSESQADHPVEVTSPYHRFASSSHASLAPSASITASNSSANFSAPLPMYTPQRPRRASSVSLSGREQGSGYLPSGLASSSSNVGLGIYYGYGDRRYSSTSQSSSHPSSHPSSHHGHQQQHHSHSTPSATPTLSFTDSSSTSDVKPYGPPSSAAGAVRPASVTGFSSYVHMHGDDDERVVVEDTPEVKMRRGLEVDEDESRGMPGVFV